MQTMAGRLRPAESVPGLLASLSRRGVRSWPSARSGGRALRTGRLLLLRRPTGYREQWAVPSSHARCLYGARLLSALLAPSALLVLSVATMSRDDVGDVNG